LYIRVRIKFTLTPISYVLIQWVTSGW